VSFIISFGTLSFSIVHVLLFIGPCVHHSDPFDEKNYSRCTARQFGGIF